MSLPADKTPWPPEGHAGRYDRMRRPEAWYKGTDAALQGVYGSRVQTTGSSIGTTLNPGGSGVVSRAIGAIRNEFWASESGDEVSTKRHLGVAQDIATLSSEQLFSERLQIRVDGPVRPADGPAGEDGEPTWRKGDPMPETAAAQARLDFTLSKCNFDATLLAAAEIGSVLGSTGLRIAFNKLAIKDRPILARVDADAIVPVYSWGMLVGVMFWSPVLNDSGNVVWRHIELHEGGKIFHGLYKGDSDNLGARYPIDALGDQVPALRDLAPLLDDDGAVTLLPDGGTTAVSIPNILPDPLDRASHAGRSDFTPAVMDLFDSIDKIYSQMMDTIDDAKSRILIADSMLEKGGIGKGKSFDLNQRVFTKVKVPPAEKEGGGLPIEKVQFEMHIAEYLSGLDALIDKAIWEAGYNSRSDRGSDGADKTATEVNNDQSRSRATRDKKIRYWQPLLEELLTGFLAVDVAEFKPRDPDTNLVIQAYPVSVTFPDAVQPTQLELANVAKALKEAGAASTYELVQTAYPELGDAEIKAIVARIRAETQVVDPITFGQGGEGVGPGDGV